MSAKKSKEEPQTKEQNSASPKTEEKIGGEEWRDRALRAQAEMANMRKRLDSDVEERTRARMEALFAELIMLQDHLGLALESLPASIEEDEAAKPFTFGVRAIHESMDGMLRRFGIETIQPIDGAAFDPTEHEAVDTVESAEQESEQLEVVRVGYRLGRRILRPAQVRLLRPIAPEQD